AGRRRALPSTAMKPIAFVLQLEGQAVELDSGRFWIETREPADSTSRCPGQLDGIGDGNTSCRRQLELWDDGSLVQTGELDYGAGDTITFRARGVLGPSADPGRK